MRLAAEPSSLNRRRPHPVQMPWWDEPRDEEAIEAVRADLEAALGLIDVLPSTSRDRQLIAGTVRDLHRRLLELLERAERNRVDELRLAAARATVAKVEAMRDQRGQGFLRRAD